MSAPDDLPRPWPFMAPIPLMPRPDAGPLCECVCKAEFELTPQELKTGVCDGCGRPFV